MSDVLDVLLSHRSIRRFKGDPIPQGMLEEWIRAGQSASTSSHVQACTVIQVSPGKKRDQIASLAGNQQYVANAPVFLVFCADMERHRKASEWHEREMLSGYAEQLLTATIDCALFAQNVAIAAEAHGAGICFIGGIRNNISAVDELLELPDLMFPLFGLCIGYADQDPETKPRLPLSVIFKQDRYDPEGDDEAIHAYDQLVFEYYRSRTDGRKMQSWTDQMAAKLEKEARPHMQRFLRSKGYLLR